MKDRHAILDRFVLCKITLHKMGGTRKNKARTAEYRRQTGNTSANVTEKLFPKNTFRDINAVISEVKNTLDTYALGSSVDGERLIAVDGVSPVRNALSQCESKLTGLFSQVRSRWHEIVDESRVMRGADYDASQYPSDPPLEEWFGVELKWRPHPKANAFAEHVLKGQEDIERQIRDTMTAEYDEYVKAAREDVMSRVADAVGEYGKKVMRLRAETYTCKNCGKQFDHRPGSLCPKCQSEGGYNWQAQEKRVYQTIKENVERLCKTLDIVIPQDVKDAHSITTAKQLAEPLLGDVSELRGSSEWQLKRKETEARQVAGDLASLVAETF